MKDPNILRISSVKIDPTMYDELGLLKIYEELENNVLNSLRSRIKKSMDTKGRVRFYIDLMVED